MKIIKIILILGVVSTLISGCGAGKSALDVEISCGEFEQEAFITNNLTINSGEEFAVKLCSNPSTGFQWSENPGNNNPEILSQSSHDFSIEGDNGSPLPPGSPGCEIWTFTTEATGTSQLTFDYSRNWEGGEKGIWTFTLDVTVQ
jgi:predicted secreted protein